MAEITDIILLKDFILSQLAKLPGGEIIHNKYVFSLIILILFIVLAKVIEFIGTRYLEKITKRTATKVDDLILEKMKYPLFLLIIVLGLKLAILNIAIDGVVNKLASCALALLFLLFLSRGVDIIIEAWGTHFAKKTKTKVDEIILPLFHKATKAIFVIVGILWVLHIFGIDITPYLAGVGISGIVLGLALQDSLKNVFGGVSLILDGTFSIGDVIKLESGDTGIIQEIGLRSTKILTYDQELIFVPNGQLANSRIYNFLKPNTRIRKKVNFSVEYGSDPEKVKKVVLEVMKKVKNIYDDPYMDVIFIEMGDSGLKFQARFWADWENAYSKWLEVTEAIYTALNKAKINIPFPTQTVYVKK